MSNTVLVSTPPLKRGKPFLQSVEEMLEQRTMFRMAEVRAAYASTSLVVMSAILTLMQSKGWILLSKKRRIQRLAKRLGVSMREGRELLYGPFPPATKPPSFRAEWLALSKNGEPK